MDITNELYFNGIPCTLNFNTDLKYALHEAETGESKDIEPDNVKPEEISDNKLETFIKSLDTDDFEVNDASTDSSVASSFIILPLPTVEPIII